MKKQTIGQVALYRQLFRDNRDFFRVVRIIKEEVAQDGSGTMLQAETVTDGLECLLSLSWDPALQSPVQEGDLWLAGFVNGDLNNGFAIQRLYNEKDKQHPKTVMGGATVLSSRKAKKIHVSNDATANLTQSAVLGPALVEWLLKLTAEVKNLADDINSLANHGRTHTHPTAALGPPSTPTPPATASATAEKTAIGQLERKTETDKFLSDLLFIQERNLPNSPESD